MSQGQILAIFAACFELCSLLWPMLPMIKLVENYKLSLYFQTSGVILPRKYSLIKVFENRFLYNRGDLRAQAEIGCGGDLIKHDTDFFCAQCG